MSRYGKQRQETVLYARVSTDEQATEGSSLRSQMEACRQYAAQHGMVRVAEFEEDYTGTTLDRPELSKIIKLFDAGKANAIVVYTADRLSRSYVDFLILRDQLEKAGIEIHYVDRGKSLPGFDGLMIDAIHGLLAQNEREKIIERTRRGKDQKSKEGRVIISTVPLGYRSNKNKSLVFHESDAEIVHKIFYWYAYGPKNGSPLSLREIARRLNDMGIPPPRSKRNGSGDGYWLAGTIYRILANEAYVGNLYYGKTRVINGKRIPQPRDNWIRVPVPPLIDDTTFQLCQKRMARNRQRSRRNQKHFYLLSGHIRCGSCKRAMTACNAGKGYYYYRCSSSTHFYATREDCEYRKLRVPCDLADVAVSEWLLGLIYDETQLIASLQRMEERALLELEPKRNRINQIQKMVQQYEKRIERLVQRVGDIDDDVVASALSREINSVVRDKNFLLDEKQRLESELQVSTYGPETQEHILQQAASIRDRIPDGTIENIRSVLNMLDVQGFISFDDKDGTKIWLDISCGFGFGGSLIELQPSWWTQLNRRIVVSKIIELR